MNFAGSLSETNPYCLSWSLSSPNSGALNPPSRTRLEMGPLTQGWHPHRALSLYDTIHRLHALSPQIPAGPMWLRVGTRHKTSVAKEANAFFFLILNNFNLNSHTCLAAPTSHGINVTVGSSQNVSVIQLYIRLAALPGGCGSH